MSSILKSVIVKDSSSVFNNKEVDILTEDGFIKEISESIDEPNVQCINAGVPNLVVTPGFFDLMVHFNDPGMEFKEGLENGLDILAKSGFTGAGLLPNTTPVIQGKSDITYIQTKANPSVVELQPFGAITLGCKGEELSEMIDMHHAGAAAFTDGVHAIQNADVLLKTLLYLQKFNGVLIQRPEDVNLNLFGSMNEGKVSTILGLKGMPSIAESLMIQRDLRILEYTKGKLHISSISTAESVQLISKAKNKGLQVTCDVAIYQLLLNDECLFEYDTNYKVNPPLRIEEDRIALIEGVKSGAIDIITSHHQPQDEESKKMEFDLAEYGMIGIQTFYPLLMRLSGEIPLETLINCCTVNPRKLLGLEVPFIEKGAPVNLTLINEQETWNFSKLTNLSNSANSPFLNQNMKGKIFGVMNGDKIVINQ